MVMMDIIIGGPKGPQMGPGNLGTDLKSICLLFSGPLFFKKLCENFEKAFAKISPNEFRGKGSVEQRSLF